jgi:N-formylglutamate amidohydrolase
MARFLTAADSAPIPPAVVHIPHAATAIPQDVRRTLLLSDGDLETELLRLTDRYTDEIFALPTTYAVLVVFPVSRLVVDPERFVEDEQEPMAAKGMGVVYSRTSDQRRLREDLLLSTRTELVAQYYFPHHDGLSEAVSTCLEAHGKCLLIDGHSFASKPLPHEPDQAPNRCDICIGTDAFHTPSWLSELAVRLAREQGFDVGINRPFSGTLVRYSATLRALQSGPAGGGCYGARGS